MKYGLSWACEYRELDAVTDDEMAYGDGMLQVLQPLEY